MWGRRPVGRAPLYFVAGFVAIFVAGGLTGVMVAVVPFNWQVHDSHFVVAHFHYVLIGGVLFPLFAGLYYWLPKVTGRLLDERPRPPALDERRRIERVGAPGIPGDGRGGGARHAGRCPALGLSRRAVALAPPFRPQLSPRDARVRRPPSGAGGLAPGATAAALLASAWLGVRASGPRRSGGHDRADGTTRLLGLGAVWMTAGFGLVLVLEGVSFVTQSWGCG